MSTPELPSLSAEPFVLRCSGPHFLKRFFAHLLIRLLIFGTLPAPLQLHVVAADDEGEDLTVVITTYEPNRIEWEADYKTRRRQP